MGLVFGFYFSVVTIMFFLFFFLGLVRNGSGSPASVMYRLNVSGGILKFSGILMTLNNRSPERCCSGMYSLSSLASR